MEPICGVKAVDQGAWDATCLVCGREEGACVTCDQGNCSRTFHVWCGRRSGLMMRKEHGAGQPMSPSEEARVRKEYGRLRKLYLERRRTCMEVLGNMSEHMGKSTRKLFEELGLEADEDYGVNRDAFPVLR